MEFVNAAEALETALIKFKDVKALVAVAGSAMHRFACLVL